MTAAPITLALVVLAVLATWSVLRTVSRAAQETFLAVVTSPANEAMTATATSARVGAVVALDEEMLIELRAASPAERVGETIAWLHSPTNVAAIVTLARWHDDQAAIQVAQQGHGVVLHNEQARVSLTRARADLSL